MTAIRTLDDPAFDGILARAANDDSLAARLLADPRGCVRTEFGLDLFPGMTLAMVKGNTPGRYVLMVKELDGGGVVITDPRGDAAFAGTDELSDAELELVSAGTRTVCQNAKDCGDAF